MTAKGEVDVAPFREAFLRSGLTASELATRLGWYRGHDGNPDQSRALRRLGLRSDRGRTSNRISPETAAKFCRALHIDPVDLDL